ncbi:MAG: translation elongation factor Ts [Candidatus Pacebacteria bacterium]|nr:translation elongation factor Ts [Candidatus Paceibacterota bacterium]
MINSEKIKDLRDKTGVSMMICKKALEETGGDEAKAMEWLSKNGMQFAEKKSERQTKAGLVEAYVHSNGRVGVLVELKTESDFVAKNSEFKEIAHNIAMHVAASGVSEMEALLEEPYIKNPSIKVSDYLNEAIQKFGENMEISRFSRFEV